jgi:hypothetical protein
MTTLPTTALTGTLAGLVLLWAGGNAGAQSRTIQGDAESVPVTVVN